MEVVDTQTKVKNLFATYKTLTGNTQQEAAAYLTLAHVIEEGFAKLSESKAPAKKGKKHVTK